ncbi:MAG: PspC domain-containing protein [Caldilineaceae bacterium]
MIRAAYVLIGLGVLWLLSNIGILGSLWGAFWTVATIFFWRRCSSGQGTCSCAAPTAGLKQDFANIRSRVKMNVNGKVPSSDEVKDGMRDVRQRIPLKRSRTDKVLLGVCGGIGQRLGIDANLVRLIWSRLQHRQHRHGCVGLRSRGPAPARGDRRGRAGQDGSPGRPGRGRLGRQRFVGPTVIKVPLQFD